MAPAKSVLALVPGVLITHRLLKNLRFFMNSKKTTAGGIRRASMTVEEAVDYSYSIFKKTDKVVCRDGDWRGKRVLEIGPGDSLATGLLCLSRGAASYCAVDRFAVGMDHEFERQVFRRVFDTLSFEQQTDCQEVLDELESGEGFTTDRFIYRNNLPIEGAPDEPGFGPFDVIFSNAVLEHVGDLPGTLLAISKLLTPSGTMLHEVDLRSHQTFEKHPLHFLEYPQWLWRLMSSHNGEPNRFRLPQYGQLLRENGISHVEFEVTESFDRDLVNRVRPRLCRLFRDMTLEELEPATFRFFVFQGGQGNQ